ncbi:hypothetical protein [Nodularia sp. UHCC 0506]|uniref:hypothetical protein n=1 Tax=Nodularia sp. UHCC 0506 TaxID=3110243 RepID=UPI002B20D191|nr:hypothetical protein [Nodularia sp. UHCC 0506]MEA5513171.1 hypothetical protein [Nodularia sp. UHCC 0506]
MTQGTIFVVMSMPEIWPVIAPTILVSNKIDTSNLKLLAFPSGHLNLRIEDSSKNFINYYTQRILVDESKYQAKRRDIILDIMWKLPEISIHINGHSLLSLDESKGDYFMVNLQNSAGETLPSYAHPDAFQACLHKVEERHTKFASTQIIGNHHNRTKTIYEQINELKNATFLLNDFSNRIQNGEHQFLGALAAELRAMLYWNGRKTYNPLLLRLAGKFSIPLPIYLMKEDAIDPILSFSPLVDFSLKEASIYKEFKTQNLTDIEDWLDRVVLVSQNETVTTKDIILNASTKLGSAHYDEDIPENLDILLNSKDSQFNQIESFLLRTASIVIHLSQYVISNIQTSMNS